MKRFIRESDGSSRIEDAVNNDDNGNDHASLGIRAQSGHDYLGNQAKTISTIAVREEGTSGGEKGIRECGRSVDVVLSDMSAPWGQTDGFWKRSISDPYHRMMNTSGVTFRDHAGSMVPTLKSSWGSHWLFTLAQDLCNAALRFASDVLRTGGHFVCKFYQGSEDKDLEMRLKAWFAKVHREKPDSSRKV